MFKLLKTKLPDDKIESIKQKVIEASKAGESDAAWQALQPLLGAQQHQDVAAFCLVQIVNSGHLPFDKAVEVLAAVYDAHTEDEKLVGRIGVALQSARDIDQLNAAPPEHPVFLKVVDKLAETSNAVRGKEPEELLLDGLATAARMVARQRDLIAEQSYQRLIEIDPTYAAYRYNLGLFYKTRGRFRDGMLANQTAAGLSDEIVDSYEWNLGICATGAGEGAVALDVWKRMGQKIEMGRFDLPDGIYPQCKVRLAERPLAERTADDDEPGLEETIWIQRLSPCHGIIRSVLCQDLGVDFGDVVLIDGAPITYHTYGDEQIPVFPHLATLLRQNYQFFDFAGTQDEPGRIADTSEELDGDAIVYAHTENFRILCASCWRNPDMDHERHDKEEKHVVHGRIAAASYVDPAILLQQIDAAVAKVDPCRIFSPDLCEAAGFGERAVFERRRYNMLSSN